MALVEIDNLLSLPAAEIARARLETAGIDAVIFDAGIASLIGPGLSGIRLMVDDSQAADARLLLGLA